MSRFASITADILARKGEARPWREVAEEVAKKPLAWQLPPQIADRPAPAPTPAACAPTENPVPQPRKCTVRISQYDYERLGILAVKKGKTRHILLQEAIGRLFTGMTEEFGVSCRCLGPAARE
jgi:hypothetical protein